MVSRVLVSLLMIAASNTVQADESRYVEIAAYVGVPADILYAMAVAESGQLSDGRLSPWPWTLNVAGEAHRFDDRSAMFEGLMAALGTGETIIDIGPMQINWHWQFDAIGSPWRITDPLVNIKFGAQILKSQYERSGDWWDAVGRYHRPADGPKNRRIADKYRERVKHFHQTTSRDGKDSDAV